jgi:DNA-binding NarL/FixJ family response regulator
MTITVLLADDHVVVRDGLQYLLEAQGDIEVVAQADNGRQAVAQAIQNHPQVVVMDISMPLLNGIEATRQICAACPTVRVVMLSIHSDVEYIHRALRAGASGYLMKESAGTELVSAVRRVQAGCRYLSLKIDETDLVNFARFNSEKSPLESLSRRELEVFQLTVEGRTSTSIAGLLSLSPKTVETYRSRIMHKLGLHDLPALVKFAVQHGITPLE